MKQVPEELLEKAAEVLRRFGRILNDGDGTAASKFLFAMHNDDVQMRIHLYQDRKSTRLNSSHVSESRMPSSA